MPAFTDNKYPFYNTLPIPGVDFPKPFLDINKYYKISNIKELLDLCQYMYYNNEIIASAIFSMSEYPITEIIVECDSPLITKEEINDIYKSLLIQLGLDYYTYGNTFLMVLPPFDNFFQCQVCKKEYLVEKFKKEDLKIAMQHFTFKCPECNAQQKAKVISRPKETVKLKELINVRLNPLSMDVRTNPYTEKSQYEITLEREVQRGVKACEPFYISTTPQLFIDAILEDKRVLLNSDKVQHLKREGVSDSHQAWGKPLLYSVLKTTYHLLLLQRAQFTIASQMIIPLNIIFPRDPNLNLGTTVSFKIMNAMIADEISRWRRTNAYIPIFPVAVEQLTVGGQGKSLFLAPELESVMKRIIVGMNVPQEFIYGGLQWTGASISLRMLENRFMRYREKLQGLLNYIADVIKTQILRGDSTVLKLTLAPLKSGDDTQRKQILMNLASAGVVSKKTLLAQMDGLDYDKEFEQIKREKDEETKAGIKVNLLNLKMQNWATNNQQQQGSEYYAGVVYPLNSPSPLSNTQSDAANAALELQQFLAAPDAEKRKMITQAGQASPEMAQLLVQLAQKGQLGGEDIQQYLLLSNAISSTQQAQPGKKPQPSGGGKPQQVPVEDTPNPDQMPRGPRKEGKL
jgi:hypothetical protein